MGAFLMWSDIFVSVFVPTLIEYDDQLKLQDITAARIKFSPIDNGEAANLRGISHQIQLGCHALWLRVRVTSCCLRCKLAAASRLQREPLNRYHRYTSGVCYCSDDGE